MSVLDPLRKLRGYIGMQFHKLVHLKDPPHSIAGGVAIGIFIGFMPPILPAKTLLSILIAWAFRCSKVAAAISVTAHDLLFPIWPFIIRWEFIIGYWMLHHQMPPKMKFAHKGGIRIEYLLDWHTYRDWTHWIHEQLAARFLQRVVGPALIGWVIIGIPLAAICYYLALQIVKKAQSVRDAKELAKEPVDSP